MAKEFNDGAGEGLFASTPPMEALRFLIRRPRCEGKRTGRTR